jgi:C-terminal processing protease CtpA/Prc
MSTNIEGKVVVLTTGSAGLGEDAARYLAARGAAVVLGARRRNRLDARENTTKQCWTQPPVPASSLTDKPVYVLTSARTISGADHFSYNFKMLKRATIVDEKTAGAAHSGVFHRIDEHFGMGIPETTPVNPFSTADWAGTGVEPDIKVKAADALEVVEKLPRRTAQTATQRDTHRDT